MTVQWHPAADQLAHTQGTDQALDTGGANEITAAQAKAGYTHSTGDGSDHADVASNTSHRGTTTGNPHSVSASDVGAYEDGRVDELIGRTAKPAGYVRMVSTKEATGNITPQVSTTTGYAAIRWWDGTVEIQSSDGGSDPDIDFSKAVPSWDDPWSGQSPKEIYIWSCAGSSDPTQSGDITYLSCFGDSLTSLDVSGCTALTTLYCHSNSLTSLDVSGLTALTTLNCSNNSITSLDVSGLTALTNLDCNDNSLTSLDVSGLTALTFLHCNNNSLTSLRAVGVVLSYYSVHIGGSDISDNNLDATALDQFYTDLDADLGSTGIIDVSSNPGADDDGPGDGGYHDYTIATGKGYTVVDDEGSFT